MTLILLLKSKEMIMKRLLIMLGLLIMLSGCIMPTYSKVCKVDTLAVDCKDIETTTMIGVRY
ncbi:MAG: hypothetical protein KAS32_10940 [Candidatus Peribacteraceae bacterium]|nr:hypothetical protein [Candidatus Peribacteraceae bacterium]